MAYKFQCTDFLLFQESLKKMRELDDKLIYSLNTSIPTESFKGQLNSESTCKYLYGQLRVTHEERENAIRQCILTSADNLKKLKNERDNKQDSIILDKKFKSEQRKLRLLQLELNVEDILKEKSHKAFNERCRAFFTVGEDNL